MSSQVSTAAAVGRFIGNAAEAGVITWAALETSGVLSIVLWVFAAFIVGSMMLLGAFRLESKRSKEDDAADLLRRINRARGMS